MEISNFSDQDLRIIWSAFVAMCDEIHSPQDTLSKEEWNRADKIKEELDIEINKRFKTE